LKQAGSGKLLLRLQHPGQTDDRGVDEDAATGATDLARSKTGKTIPQNRKKKPVFFKMNEKGLVKKVVTRVTRRGGMRAAPCVLGLITAAATLFSTCQLTRLLLIKHLA